MDQRRLILFLVFSFALVMLWDGWLKHNQPPVAAQQAATAGAAAPADGAVPTPTLTAPAAGAPVVPGEQAAASAAAPRVVVETDLLRAEVSAQGGDIVRLELKQHKASGEAGGNFVLFD
ncbi:MAG: membrane protein insertase YidC, partial [Thauera sp.]|nr:membrane protein insertase YidC [Thauera sp.]